MEKPKCFILKKRETIAVKRADSNPLKNRSSGLQIHPVYDYKIQPDLTIGEIPS